MLERAPQIARCPDRLPLTARGLSLRLDGKQLIRDINLTLSAGKRTIILGANGAGKSLLLRLLHGLIEPTSGEILWAGRTADKETRQGQAMVFQRPVLLRRSALANIKFVLASSPLRKDLRDQWARACLQLANLGDLAATPARALSGGEQQRLAIARALALEPEVLFLDEPSAHLDPAATLSVEQLIESAHENGKKIIMVTHDIGQARRIADEIIFLHQGAIAEKADAASFFASPSSPAARAYLEGRIIL